MTGLDENSHIVPVAPFDYDFDQADPVEPEKDFLQVQAEFLCELLVWLTEPKETAAIGRRVLAVTRIAAPELCRKRKTQTPAVDRQRDGALRVLEKKFGPSFRSRLASFQSTRADG
jgi:hypothetical protein